MGHHTLKPSNTFKKQHFNSTHYLINVSILFKFCHGIYFSQCLLWPKKMKTILNSHPLQANKKCWVVLFPPQNV